MKVGTFVNFLTVMPVQGSWCSEFTLWSVLCTFKWLWVTTLRTLRCRRVFIQVRNPVSTAASAGRCSQRGHVVCTRVAAALHQRPGGVWCVRA